MRVLIMVIVIMLASFGNASGTEDFPDLRSIAVVVYDGDLGETLYERNPDERRSIASLTKIMTLLYIAELVERGDISLQDEVTASAVAASRGGTSIDLRQGDTFTVEELLYATALRSANDAAVALAEHIAGSEQNFARHMTDRAIELGLTNTNFTDSTGLLSIYSNNFSSARDVAILSSLALENDLVHRLVSTKEYYLAAQDRNIRNTNVLLHELADVDGMKTGATTPAGHCLVTTALRDNRRLIIVVLGAPSRPIRNTESEQLLQWAYSTLETIIPRDQVVGEVPVKDGVTHTVRVVPKDNVSIFAVDDEARDIETRVEPLAEVRAPIDRGEKVGELVLLRGGNEFGRVDLVARDDTGFATFLRRFYNQMIGFLGWLF